jgi:type I restriction enzyme S subunit
MSNIKQGYKQTDIGVIPEDWEVKTIGETLIIRHGRDQKAVVTIDGKYPILGTGGLMGYANRFLYNQDSVLIGRKGTINKPMFMNKPFWTVDTLFYSEIKKGHLAKFIYYKFQMIDWYAYNEASGVPSLNAKTIESIDISIPKNFTEQTAIATALSDTDALIAALDKKIAKKQQIKQGAMQQLLTGKKRLPGFCGEWAFIKLGSVTDISRGGSPRPIENYLTNDVNGVNWIKIGDVGVNAKFIESTEEKIIQEGVSRSRFVKKGDFLLSNSMSFGRPYILKVDGCIHDGWLVIQNYQETFNTDYLYYMLGFESTLTQYKSVAAGSSVLNLNKQIVSNVLIFCPQKDEQTAIAQILTDMDNEIAQLEKERDKYKEMKAGMMQVLLTGKVRLV